MPTEQQVLALQGELAALQETNDGLYRQHANEKAQMQLAIEQEKVRVAELEAANTAYTEENEQWRASYGQLESDKYEMEERLESQKRELEEKIAMLEETVKGFTSELVNDLEELEKEKSTRETSEELVTELQRKINEGDERFSQLTSEYDNLYTTYQQLQTTCYSLEQEKEELSNTHQETITNLGAEAAALQSRVNYLEGQLAALTANDEVKQVNQSAHLRLAEQQVQAKDSEILQLRQRIKSLEDELNIIALAGSGKGADLTAVVRELQHQLFTKSEQLVQQGEKNLALSQASEQTRQQLQQLVDEVTETRSVLLRAIAGDDTVDVRLYKHVRLTELLRLRIKALEHEWILTDNSSSGNCSTGEDTNSPTELEDGGESDSASAMPSCHLRNVESFSAIDGLGSIGKLERELRLTRSRNKRLQERSQHLEQELEAAHSTLKDVQAMKEKVVELTGKERVEKELRGKSEANCKEYAEKIGVLSEHIEKLMVHLKHEAAAKMKAVDALRRSEKELGDTRDKLTAMTRKSGAKEQQIQELEQGARILEDQLRLMDEKFIDVRNKLDWTRATSQKDIKKLSNELSSLRMKWQLATDAGVMSLLPDWASSKLGASSNTTPGKKPLAASSSEPRLGNNPLGSGRAELSPVHRSGAASSSQPADDPLLLKKTRFEIPKLPQPEADGGTPWSDARLAALQRSLQLKQRL